MMLKTIKMLAVAGVLGSGMLVALPRAEAGSNWSVGISFGTVFAPAPVVYTPVRPAPVYYVPAAPVVVYQPAPVVVAPVCVPAPVMLRPGYDRWHPGWDRGGWDRRGPGGWDRYGRDDRGRDHR